MSRRAARASAEPARRDPRGGAGAAARRPSRYRVDCERDLRAEIARRLAAEVELVGIHFAAPSLNEVYNRYFEEARDAAQSRRGGAARLALDRGRRVVAKETADHLSGARMWLLEALVFLTAIAAAYAAILSIRATIGESPFLFLRLLTMAQDPLPSFIALLGFLIPLVAIALGFDAINGEFNRRTMSRILAQPIYRDALLLGQIPRRAAGADDRPASRCGCW